MLYRYKCTDLGLNCHFEIKGATVKEVTQKAMEHIQEMHPNDFKSLRSPAEIEQMEQALARSVRVVSG
ncbi:MAG TPA: DUF1059 domain-containing protein [Anaerolineaceae bacterium]|jgi:predicted small metal-binding protein|nr:DUF1059 domain-containing protein [Anaerolineaceae bacterium]